MKYFNGFKVLHHDETIPDNTNYSKKDNTTQSKILSNNINFKETSRPQVAVNAFPERQHTFQSHKSVPCQRPYSEAPNARVYNNNKIIVFSYSIASFERNNRSNFNNQLKEGRAIDSNIFLVPLQMISCFILNQHLEKVDLTQQ